MKDPNLCFQCPDIDTCSISKMPEYDCCHTCVYMRDCLIKGDLVHWCKAYAEIDPHDRLAKLNECERCTMPNNCQGCPNERG